MESKRPTGERPSPRLAGNLLILTVILPVVILASCTNDSYGFSGTNMPDALAISSDTDEILVRVELDTGYEAAEDFEQRAVLTMGETSTHATQHGLAEPFVLRVTKGEFPGQLELMLGFCHSLNKEVCFVDRAVLAIESERIHESRVEAQTVVLRYRPRPPQ